jgi:hypothetical protein
MSRTVDEPDPNAGRCKHEADRHGWPESHPSLSAKASHAPASNSDREGAALLARQVPRFLAAVYIWYHKRCEWRHNYGEEDHG